MWLGLSREVTMQTEVMKLGLLLSRADELPQNHGIFGRLDETTSLETNVMIADFDCLEDEEDEPSEARELGFKSLLTTGELKDVVYSASLQKQELAPGDLLRAFLHYMYNDSYVNFD